MKLGEAMYKAAQEEGGDDAEASADGGKDGDDATVVDADFEEVNPDKDGPNKDGKDKKDD